MSFGINVVIQVAPYMTQYERQAILDAAELAGLNVLTLIHDETAGNLMDR